MVSYCGVVLAGGKGTRMGELTRVTNKHLLPVGRWPMIYHPLQKLVGAGIHNILIVSGTEHMGDFVELLGSGSRFGCHLTYRVQDEAGGIAQALALAEGFCCGNGWPVVLLGDNIFQDDLDAGLSLHAKYASEEEPALVVLKRVPDPQRYGVAYMGRKGEPNPAVRTILEKPQQLDPLGDYYAVTGIYVYPPDVFREIRKLTPSPRGEYEITDVNNAYLQQYRLRHCTLTGYWTDAGTLDSIALANELVREYPPRFAPAAA